MKENRNYTLYFDSSWGSLPDNPDVEAIDLAGRPEQARALIDLGLLLREDLPCLIARDRRGKICLIQLNASPDDVRAIVAGQPRGQDPIVVYGGAWCPDCRLAKRILEESDRSYREVTIDEDPVAEQLVISRSGGRRVIPTIVFGERLLAFNPPPVELKTMLHESSVVGVSSTWEETS